MHRRPEISSAAAIAVLTVAAAFAAPRPAAAKKAAAVADPVEATSPEAEAAAAQAAAEAATKLPALPGSVERECWLRPAPGEPEPPCELELGRPSDKLFDHAVLVRERAGARRRGIAMMVRGATAAELLGAGHAAGSLGAELGWMKEWNVVHPREPNSLDTDSLLLSPAAPPRAGKLAANVLVVRNGEDAEMRALELHGRSLFRALGLVDRARRFVAFDVLERSAVEPIKSWLLPGLEDPDELVRLAVAAVLAESKVADATPTLAAWLAPDRADVSPFSHAAIARDLGKLAAPAAAPALERALADVGPDAREAATWALGQIAGRPASGLVAARLRDDDPRVRREAATTLGREGGTSAETALVEPALVEAFADPDVRTRIASVRAVQKLALPAAVPGLIERLRDSEGEVRLAAVEALGKLKARAAVPHLIAMLKDDKGVRMSRYGGRCFSISQWRYAPCLAAEALTEIGDPAGLAAIKKMDRRCPPKMF